jgi:glycosyltransferase involved in cell wall biosynthesis
MKVLVNFISFLKDGGGTRYYAQSLLEEFDSNFKYISSDFTLVCTPNNETFVRSVFADSRHEIKVVTSIEEIILISKEYDLYFSPLNNLHPVLDIPSVASLMDVQEKYLPENFTTAELEERQRVYSTLCVQSDKIITISSFCKKGICEFYKARESDVHVIYLAPQKQIVSCNPTEVNELVGIDFILYPSSFYKHKNHIELIEAISLLKKEFPTLPRFVFTGSLLNRSEEILSLIQSRELTNLIHIYEHLKPEQLKWMYLNSRFMLSVSLFEGYSMPIIEALAFGAPVVCNDSSAIREVSGPFPTYMNLTCRYNIKKSLSYILNKKLPRKTQLSLYHNWSTIADEHWKCFENAVNYTR